MRHCLWTSKETRLVKHVNSATHAIVAYCYTLYGRLTISSTLQAYEHKINTTLLDVSCSTVQYIVSALIALRYVYHLHLKRQGTSMCESFPGHPL